MPNKLSAKKELRKGKKRAIANLEVKNTMKTMVKNDLKKIQGGDKGVATGFNLTVKAIDKAAKKGIIKKQTAARKKSRLQKKINSLVK